MTFGYKIVLNFFILIFTRLYGLIETGKSTRFVKSSAAFCLDFISPYECVDDVAEA